MQDLASFRGDIREGWESGVSVVSGRGTSCFIGLGCEIGKGNRAGYGISIPA